MEKEIEREAEQSVETERLNGVLITADTRRFIMLANNPATRPDLLARLQA